VTANPQDRGGSAGAGQPSRPPRREPRPGLLIGRPFGIPVYLSPYWILIALLLVISYANTVGQENIANPVTRYAVEAAFVILLYASVLVHELAHCVVARGFGLSVRRVLLYALGGYSEIEQEAPSPGKDALISAAGPFASFAIAGLAYWLSRIAAGGIGHILLFQVFWSNRLIGFFNLLPGLPLDGGRIFRAGVWKVTGKQAQATVAAAWAGRVLAIVLAGLGLAGLATPRSNFLSLFSIWFMVIAAFIWLQSTQAIKAAKVSERLPLVSGRRLARRAIGVPASTPLAEAVRRAQAAEARALVIVDHEGTPTAIVSESAVLATPDERRPWIEAGALARSLEPGLVLSADLSGIDLIRAVQQSPASEYLLIEPTGQIFGVLATDDLNVAFAGV
jgi:Zn-dependent protease